MMELDKAVEIVGHRGYGYPEDEAQEAFEMVLGIAEKEKAEPIITMHNAGMKIYYQCPNCHKAVFNGLNYCGYCGKHLDWADYKMTCEIPRKSNMTEIEAIEILKKCKKCDDIDDDLDACPVDECRKCPYRVTGAELDEAYDMAIKSLRETGHVERCVLD